MIRDVKFLGGGKGGWRFVMSLWISEQSGKADSGENAAQFAGSPAPFAC